MTREMADRTSEIPTGIGKKEEKNLEVRDALTWVKKETFSLKGAKRDEVRDLLRHRSVAVVGEDPATGETVFDVQFPQLTVSTREEVKLAQRQAEKIWGNGLSGALRSGLINEEKFWEIQKEGRPFLNLRGLDKVYRLSPNLPKTEGTPGRVSAPISPVSRAAERLPARKRAFLVGSTLIAAAGCTIVPSITPSATEIQQSTQTVFEPSATLTQKIIATETKTPTVEIRPFTDPEVKAASSFSLSAWPDRLRKPMEHPETATQKELDDSFEFLLAVREKDGIPRTTKDKVGPLYQSLWNGTKWMEDHPDEVKEKHLLLQLHPYEIKAMYEDRKVPVWHDKDDATYGISGVQLPAAEPYQYDSKNIGKIAGLDVDSGRFPFDTAYGKLVGFGEIGGQKVILIDMKDKDGYHVLLPVVVYKDGVTLPKGSKCLVMNKNYADKHGGKALFNTPADIRLTSVPWDSLYDGLGKIVYVQGGYSRELQDKFGVAAVYCFSLTLNLEVADSVVVTDLIVSSSP